MAQRQRAGLITPRSQDRNLLPVNFVFPHENPNTFSRRPPQLCDTRLELVALHCGKAGSRPYTPGHYDVDTPPRTWNPAAGIFTGFDAAIQVGTYDRLQARPCASYCHGRGYNYTNTNCTKQTPIKSVRIGIMRCISLLHLAAASRCCSACMAFGSVCLEFMLFCLMNTDS